MKGQNSNAGYINPAPDTIIPEKTGNLLNDSLFFQAQTGEFIDWLQAKNLTRALSFDTLEIFSDYLQLKLNIRDFETWNNFISAVDTVNGEFRGEKFGQWVLNKLAFLLQISPDSVQIEINSINKLPSERVRVIIKQSEGSFKMYAPLIMRKPIVDSLFFPVGKIKAVTGQEMISADIQDVKQKLVDRIRNYYSDKGVLWGSANCYILDNNNKITVEVTNLKGEVLYDCGWRCYFEMIRIEINLFHQKEFLKINYSIDGKYGTGVFVAPRRSCYKDFETLYQQYIDDYSIKIKKEIFESVKKP
jgi:hypothetical protein